LVTLPVPLFIALKTVACLGITLGAVTLTVFWSMHVARTENRELAY
jgi:hypothetical protein